MSRISSPVRTYHCGPPKLIRFVSLTVRPVPMQSITSWAS
jgi:hypothetical protein